eukprot:TRINITY_DN7049_c0_g1_i2.p1 TRINITY_DN7049_c0_g1~~TRINITY_DN7049_c0_g1_i2.p1  ORF type:complete len:470 (+),score=35.17 TRINITY_DN7049_c0_g1_i2:14-1423(+)
MAASQMSSALQTVCDVIKCSGLVEIYPEVIHVSDLNAYQLAILNAEIEIEFKSTGCMLSASFAFGRGCKDSSDLAWRLMEIPKSVRGPTSLTALMRELVRKPRTARMTTHQHEPTDAELIYAAMLPSLREHGMLFSSIDNINNAHTLRFICQNLLQMVKNKLTLYDTFDVDQDIADAVATWQQANAARRIELHISPTSSAQTSKFALAPNLIWMQRCSTTLMNRVISSLTKPITVMHLVDPKLRGNNPVDVSSVVSASTRLRSQALIKLHAHRVQLLILDNALATTSDIDCLCHELHLGGMFAAPASAADVLVRRTQCVIFTTAGSCDASRLPKQPAPHVRWCTAVPDDQLGLGAQMARLRHLFPNAVWVFVDTTHASRFFSLNQASIARFCRYYSVGVRRPQLTDMEWLLYHHHQEPFDAGKQRSGARIAFDSRLRSGAPLLDSVAIVIFGSVLPPLIALCVRLGLRL